MNSTQIDLGYAKEQLLEHFSTASYPVLAIYFLIFYNVLSLFSSKPPVVPGAKLVGRKFWWEPSLILQFRYFFGAYDILTTGYTKFKNVPYVVRRFDTDVTMLPTRYLEELGIMAKTKVNSKVHAIGNLAPEWTGVAAMLETYLPNRALTDNLTPNLNKYVAMAVEEINHSWDLDIPQADSWTEVDIQKAVARLVSRMSAKVFVGDSACRDPNWLKISTELTEDILMSALAIRTFPKWALPVVSRLLPSLWRVKGHMREAKKIMRKSIDEYNEAKNNGRVPEDTILNYMLANGTEKETSVDFMAQVQGFLTSASIHTTASGIASCLFELCEHPEIITMLREELQEVISEHGALGAPDGIPIKQWFQKVEKMDSFILEVQRFHPTVFVGPTRAVLQPVTLKDGLQIPAGATVSWAAHHISMDPEFTPEPEVFNPLRSYNKRYADEKSHNRFLAGQPATDQLTFGFGGQACPGRYFAISELKLILTKVLLNYDIAFPAGKGNPKSFKISEFFIVDPRAKLMMKKRDL